MDIYIYGHISDIGGGWAVYIPGNEQLNIQGCLPFTDCQTRHRCQVRALYYALLQIYKYRLNNVRIYTKHQYLVNKYIENPDASHEYNDLWKYIFNMRREDIKVYYIQQSPHLFKTRQLASTIEQINPTSKQIIPAIFNTQILNEYLNCEKIPIKQEITKLGQLYTSPSITGYLYILYTGNVYIMGNRWLEIMNTLNLIA